jgi:hypothetical protein
MSRSLRSKTRHAIVLVASLFVALLASAAVARADEPPPASEPPLPAQVDLQKDIKDAKAAPVEDALAPTPEAPPPPPYKKTLVLDSSIGVVAFVGQFRKIAPPGPRLHVQLGYEFLKWLMLYGEGELAFTDTSMKQAQPNTRAFAMFGFGGGVRFTVRFTDRIGVYAQAGLGALKADVATNALGILGFRGAESLDVYFGARLGVEWYQVDRHFALGVHAGPRLAQGFAKTGASRDTPALVDGGVSLRYAF